MQSVHKLLHRTKSDFLEIKNYNYNYFNPVVDCKHSEWEEWITCSKSCGTGSKSRTRQIVNKASNGGNDCNSTIETADCNVDSCPGK